MRRHLLVLGLILGGCGPKTQTPESPTTAAPGASATTDSTTDANADGVPEPASTATGPVPKTTIPPESSPDPSSMGARPLPSLASFFQKAGVEGAIVWFDTQSKSLVSSDASRAAKSYLPASTFKIPNSLIGLENGVVTNAESIMPWDGQETAVPEWNRDNTLRSAFQTSCVPCFQQIPRLLGEGAMQNWVKRLAYGNQDTSGGLDSFWLRGGLRISPLQQVGFLWRLDNGKLAVSPESRATVVDILELERGPGYVLRGKTGLVTQPDVPVDLGWFVGWVEQGARRVYFATVLDGHRPDVKLAPLRISLTKQILRAQKLLP